MEREPNLAVNIRGDLGQRPEGIPLGLKLLLDGRCDIALGSRLKHLLTLRDEYGWRSPLKADSHQTTPLSRVMGHFDLTWFQ